jgi:hypothetical protein
MDRLILKVTRKEFEHLRGLQVKKRWDWPATFSTNAKGEIWPYVSRGWTRPEDREEVSGLSSVIDEVARFYLKVRSDGGRFFIDDLGASHKSDEIGGPLNLFVFFEFRD